MNSVMQCKGLYLMTVIWASVYYRGWNQQFDLPGDLVPIAACGFFISFFYMQLQRRAKYDNIKTTIGCAWLTVVVYHGAQGLDVLSLPIITIPLIGFYIGAALAYALVDTMGFNRAAQHI